MSHFQTTEILGADPASNRTPPRSAAQSLDTARGILLGLTLGMSVWLVLIWMWLSWS